MPIRQAAIVAIGDEVLQGEVINTNAAWLAAALGTMGVLVSSQCVVGDRLEDIMAAADWALDRADLIVFCGGLGPTHDDCTSEAISEWTGQGLVIDEGVRRRIEARYGSRAGAEAAVLKQATVVGGALLLENSRGTAPGQLIAYREKWLVLLPGPPRELQAIFEEGLKPWLNAETIQESGARRDTLVSYELGESQLFHHLENLAWGQHPLVGIYASPGRVEFRMQGPADIPNGSLNTKRAEAWARSQVPSKLYSPSGSRVERLIEAMIHRGLHLAIMESLTGGLVASSLIAVEGASQCVQGSVIAYTEEVKIRFGVDPAIIERYGAVSAQCAKAMA
ncbi:MAG: molybdopterin-binding protein, partial [Firmicutes bacterium]|nr:molybdopterin-binding protein [Bacillota bacterium]